RGRGRRVAAPGSSGRPRSRETPLLIAGRGRSTGGGAAGGGSVAAGFAVGIARALAWGVGRAARGVPVAGCEQIVPGPLLGIGQVHVPPKGFDKLEGLADAGGGAAVGALHVADLAVEVVGRGQEDAL